MRDKIIDILCEICADDSIRENSDVDLLDSGLLDSLAFIELLDALYDEFGVEFQPTIIPKEHFRTAAKIEQLIREKYK